jgi:hypothetical protein
MKSFKNIVGVASVMVGLFATGCAGNVEPQEEQIQHAQVGSPTRTAEASAFFRIMCPWGSYYSFCSDKDVSSASADDCDVTECSCEGGSNRKSIVCNGQVMYTSPVCPE